MANSDSEIVRDKIAKRAVDQLASKCGFHYEELLGKGTYGTVIKVKNFEGEYLAAKIVERRHVNPQEKITWPDLQHENILRLLDIIDEVDDVVIFITSVLGPTLYCHLRSTEFKEDTSALARCKAYARQVLSGMSYLHRMDMCHLDLRAENVLMTLVGDRAVIADFSGLRYTKFYIIHCPLPRALRPPELLRRHKTPVCPKSVDLWSCGLLLANVYLGRWFYKFVLKSECASRKQALSVYTKLFRDENCVQSFTGETYTKCSMSEVDVKALTSLLRGFLHKRPVRRIKAEEGLSHPFFLGDSSRTTNGDAVPAESNMTLQSTNAETDEDSVTAVDDSGEIKVASPEEPPKKIDSIVSNNSSAAKDVKKKKKKKWSRYFRRFSKLFRLRSFFQTDKDQKNE